MSNEVNARTSLQRETYQQVTRYFTDDGQMSTQEYRGNNNLVSGGCHRRPDLGTIHTLPFDPPKNDQVGTPTDADSKYTQVMDKFVGMFEKVLDMLTKLIAQLGSAKTEAASGVATPAVTDTTAPTVADGDASATTQAGTTTQENSKSSELGSTGGFLWKPKSDKDGKLAILLPKSLNGKIKSVSILDPNDKHVISTGKYSGEGNGSRTHFRFDKPGSKYPDGAIVDITLNDGTHQTIKIENTAARFQK